MNRYIIKLPFIFSWCLSHTRADTHDCTLTFRRSNKVLFPQLASAKLSGEERCLILVKTHPMHCRHRWSPHVQHLRRALSPGIGHRFRAPFRLNSRPLFLVKRFEIEASIFRRSQCAAHLCLLSLGGSICLQSDQSPT